MLTLFFFKYPNVHQPMAGNPDDVPPAVDVSLCNVTDIVNDEKE